MKNIRLAPLGCALLFALAAPAHAWNVKNPTTGAVQLKLDNSGNLGVGTTSPSGKLHVVDTTVSDRAIQATGRIYGIVATASADAAVNDGGFAGYFQHTGANGIGVYARGEHYGILATTGGSGGWAVYANGPTYSAGGYTTSDGRLKESVKTVESNLDKIVKMRPVSFLWKRDADQSKGSPGEQYGFIAQEMQKIIPGVVREVETPKLPEMLPVPDKDGKVAAKPQSKTTQLRAKSLNEQLGKTLSIEYTDIIPFAVGAIQELKRENDALRAAVCELKPTTTICRQVKP